MVGIKNFAVVESICKPRLRISTSTAESTFLRSERPKEPTPHAADSIVGRSLALFVHLSTTSPPTPALHARARLTTVFQPMAPLPHHAQLNKLRRHFAPQSHTSRFKSISSWSCHLTRRNAPALSHWTCPTSARSSSPFLLKNLRAGLTIQSQCKRFGSTSQRVVADAMSAQEFIIYSFNQPRWRDLLWKTVTCGDR